MPSPACTGNCWSHAPLDEVCDYCARGFRVRSPCPVCGNEDPALVAVEYTTLTFASGAPDQVIPVYSRCLVCQPGDAP